MSIKPTDPPKPDPEVRKNAGLAGKKLILKRNHGFSQEELDQIETVEDADEVLSALKKENAESKPDTKKVPAAPELVLKANFGGMKPEEVPASERSSADDHLRPLKRNLNLGLRFNSLSRILPFFDEEYPDGRIG